MKKKFDRKEAAKMLQSIKSKPELLARAQQLMSALGLGNTEPVDSLDADLKYTKGPRQNHRERLSFFDRQYITNSDGKKRITIATRQPDGADGAGLLLHGNKKACIGFVINCENGQSSIQLIDDNDIVRLQIGLGANGVPFIIFKDEKGRESFGLTDRLVRFGEANKAQIEFERKDSDVSLCVSGGKRKGQTLIATLDGEPAMAMTDSKNVNQVHIAPQAEDMSIGVLRRGKYIWTAKPEAKSSTVDSALTPKRHSAAGKVRARPRRAS